MEFISERMKRKILITGGAGFIGSHVVRRFVEGYPDYAIFNLDKLTYAGNLENLQSIENASNYTFIKADIVDEIETGRLFEVHQFTDVIHLAAESHVDRSITSPTDFVKTNIIGTVNLLNAAKKSWGSTLANKEATSHRFYHISTDEVFGSLGPSGFFSEETAYNPHSPYSASKASSDHLVRAYGDTYGLPFIITNCSNNYGPFQFPEKLIPLALNNIRLEKPVPLYGNGLNIRDWLFVEDHAAAIDLCFHQSKIGETYTIGGHNEWTNFDLLHLLFKLMDQKLGRAAGSSAKLLTYVTDRAGHDARYAIDATKIQKDLGWKPSVTFEEGLSKTVDWYLSNTRWLENVTSGSYQAYYKAHYAIQ